MSTQSIAIRRYQCRHVFTDGHRCGSPCLRGANGPEDFCYYHHATRRPRVSPHDPYNEPPNQTTFSMPVPEDHSSIQFAVGQVMNGLAGNSLDARRAGLLLYALQIASKNLGSAPKHTSKDIVHDITFDPTQGALAPMCEVPEDANMRDFLENYEAYKAADEEDEDDEDDDY